MRLPYSERIAWLLIGLLVAFWVWFGVASAFEERLGWRNLLLHLLIPGGLFAIIAAIAWRSRLAGGVLLVVAGLVVMAGYPLVDGEFFTASTLVFVVLAMAVPPIAAGLLLLEARRLTHR